MKRPFRVLATPASESLSEKPKTLTSGNSFADWSMNSSYASLVSSPINESYKNPVKAVAQVAGQRSRLAIVELIAFSSLLALIACNSTRKPSDANFTNAINQYLAKDGRTCTTIGRQFPIDIPASAPQSQYGFGPQLAALQQAGLVSGTDTTAVVHGMLDTLRGSAPPQPVRRYQLTAEGQKYFNQVPGTFGQTGGLCYGQKAVDSVLKWTDPVMAEGHSQTEVAYTYKIVNLAGWTGQSEIQQAFPDIKATVDGASNTSETVGLQLTGKGWEVVGR